MSRVPLWLWFVLTMLASALGGSLAAFVRTLLDNESRRRRKKKKQQQKR